MITGSISEQEDLLFSEWRKQCQGLVCDGAVDEEVFRDSKPRVLLILKDVIDTTDGGGWDLRSELRKAERWQTWNMVTRWMIGIRRIECDLPWRDVKEVDVNTRRHFLRGLSVMNLKKSPGGPNSDWMKLEEEAAKYSTLLRRQFELYDADLVICAGTADIFSRSVFAGEELIWNCTSRNVCYSEFAPKRFILDYCHPQARYPHSFLYYGLIDAVRELWGNSYLRYEDG